MGLRERDFFSDGRKPARLGEYVIEPAGWSSREMVDNKDWLHVFKEKEIEEIRRCVADHDIDGVDLMQLKRQDFNLKFDIYYPNIHSCSHHKMNPAHYVLNCVLKVKIIITELYLADNHTNNIMI